MNHANIDRFRRLWTSDVAKYVLVSQCASSDDFSKCTIFNKETKMAVIIEENDVNLEVKKKMKEAGVPVVDRLP